MKSFKPNYLKKRGNDFEFFFKNCSSNEPLSPQKIRMSRKIPVREIFAPDSAENCKKSKNLNWWQILQKTAQTTMVIFLKIVILMIFYHLKQTACPGRFRFLRYLRRTVQKIAKNRKKTIFFKFQAKLFEKGNQRF